MAKKEFKVGEVFQCGLVKLKCVVEPMNRSERCDECFFDDNGECIDKFDNIVGKCSHLNREDKTNVIFVKVEERDMFGDFILWLKKFIKQNFLCVHHYVKYHSRIYSVSLGASAR